MATPSGPTTITGLPAAATLTGTELIPMDQGGSGLGVNATINNVITKGIPSALTAATATTAIAGTELLPVDQSSTLKKSTIAQLISQATSSTAIAGTELFGNVGSSYQNTTIAQIVTQATAAGNPSASDLIFSTQSGNLRASSVGALTAFCPYIIGGGTANAQTVTLAPVPASYYTGMVVVYLPLAANTGATTLNVNGLGTKNIFAYGAALLGGELQTNVPAELIYDGTQFQFLNPNDSTGSFTITLTGFTAGVTGTVNWRIVKGKTAVISVMSNISGTSNTTAMTGTGIPTAIVSTSSHRPFAIGEDASNVQVFFVNNVNSTTWSFSTFAGAFTASGTKGLLACEFVYSLI